MLAPSMIPEPAALLGLVVVGAVYGRGVQRVWSRAGRGRGVREWQVAVFGGGLLAVLLALESPLDRLGEDLFTAHMLQHLLLILVAAPMLVLAAPLAALVWGLPADARRGVASLWKLVPGVLSRPASAFVLHGLVLWAWHTPSLYEAALGNRLVHVAEHACFLGSGALFWWALLHGRSGQGYGAGVLYVFGMALQSTALGALLTFARAPWYTSHQASAPAWGLTPLEDQQLAGLIMWVPGGLIYLAAALALFAAWLRVGEIADAPRPAGHTPARQ